nr:ORF56 protein [Citropsis gilletiana]BEV75606.1 ORF56 protein [Citropsis gilletiana]BEV75683.1 ORF56 protein [Citropsis schweinfurthii]BEV75697.1 ORF56 protein [Citropsis schweinfurthii]
MWFRRIQLQENQERRAFPPFPPPLFGLAGFKNE